MAIVRNKISADNVSMLFLTTKRESVYDQLF